MQRIPTKAELIEARKKLIPYIHYTPIFQSKAINQIAEAELFFKAENMQKMGAFKMRGAMHATLQLSKEQQQKGIATHSSGNFAQAMALSAQLLGIPAWAVMPSNAPAVKKAAVASYGARIIECEPNLKAREAALEQVVNENHCTSLHPYNDYDVILGNSTASQEIFEQIEKIDYLLSPVGGGGLISGTALAAHYFSPQTKVIGAEPKLADDAFRSLECGIIQAPTNTLTIADGLRTSLGDKTFFFIKEFVDQIQLAEEEEIIAAMRLIWERMKIIVEPSSAISLAVVLKNKNFYKGKRIALLLSGGNVDLGKLPF
jgi:threonine dehydratase